MIPSRRPDPDTLSSPATGLRGHLCCIPLLDTGIKHSHRPRTTIICSEDWHWKQRSKFRIQDLEKDLEKIWWNPSSWWTFITRTVLSYSEDIYLARWHQAPLSSSICTTLFSHDLYIWGRLQCVALPYPYPNATQRYATHPFSVYVLQHTRVYGE